MHYSVIALIVAALSAAAFPVDPLTGWQTNQQSVANQIRYNNIQLQFNSLVKSFSSFAAQHNQAQQTQSASSSTSTSTDTSTTATTTTTTTPNINNLRFAVVATSSGTPIYQVTSIGGTAFTLATGTEGVTTTFAGFTFTVPSPTSTSASSSSASTGASTTSGSSSMITSTRTRSSTAPTATSTTSSSSSSSSASSSSSSSSSTSTGSSTTSSSSSSSSSSPQNLNVKHSDGAISGRVGLAHFAGVLGGIVAGALMVV
ncbi:hypothetical protein K474DRAFT_1712820 [Panus rudis PR-1116 ss-1]|nr:hypothetical protein K474DRAFT_1712820 [Panus rudis PR-1116 ss-1]